MRERPGDQTISTIEKPVSSDRRMEELFKQRGPIMIALMEVRARVLRAHPELAEGAHPDANGDSERTMGDSSERALLDFFARILETPNQFKKLGITAGEVTQARTALRITQGIANIHSKINERARVAAAVGVEKLDEEVLEKKIEGAFGVLRPYIEQFWAEDRIIRPGAKRYMHLMGRLGNFRDGYLRRLGSLHSNSSEERDPLLVLMPRHGKESALPDQTLNFVAEAKRVRQIIEAHITMFGKRMKEMDGFPRNTRKDLPFVFAGERIEPVTLQRVLEEVIPRVDKKFAINPDESPEAFFERLASGLNTRAAKLTGNKNVAALQEYLFRVCPRTVAVLNVTGQMSEPKTGKQRLAEAIFPQQKRGRRPNATRSLGHVSIGLLDKAGQNGGVKVTDELAAALGTSRQQLLNTAGRMKQSGYLMRTAPGVFQRTEKPIANNGGAQPTPTPAGTFKEEGDDFEENDEVDDDIDAVDSIR